ncbi:MAG: AAA family ATPase [Gammaproteobacteria bacterium]|nr:AAA family ATPase [Gammaproteobacteria bacterium]
MEVSFGPAFLPSLDDLAPASTSRILQAIQRFQSNSSSPGLNFEKLHGRAGAKRLWTFRASQSLRVLVAREGETAVALFAGEHNAVYELADKSAFVVPKAGAPTLIRFAASNGPTDDTAATDMAGMPTARLDDPGRSILDHWTTPELLRAGFNESDVAVLRTVRGEDALLDALPDEAKLDLAIECSEKSPEEFFQPEMFGDDGATDFRDAIVKRGALAGLSSLLDADEMARLLSGPIEDWMLFLHPEQRAIVDRHYSGPARVRGSAGTGKTVVAIHRAAALAQRDATPGKPTILFTTFIKSLPPVFKNLYQRLPNAVPGAVEFVHIDRLANRVCREAGIVPALNKAHIDQAFDGAWADVVGPGTPLRTSRLTRYYVRDEVREVIKGRGIDSLDEYLRMERTGRRTRFTSAMRRQAWTLREEWDRRMAAAGVTDFPDVVRWARDLARKRQSPTFRSAIVDEGQDFTLVGLQFVQALVAPARQPDSPNGLFIVGDGAQKIYPGGFTLAQAGIDVRGNSSVLRVNYRNSHEIITAAMACTGSEQVDDIGETYLRGDEDVRGISARQGVKPVLFRGGDFGGQIRYVAETAKRLANAASLDLGDIGVLAPTNKLVNQTQGGLQAMSVDCQPLANFDGTSTSRVKIGTFKRAKGLEFKVVFLLGLGDDSFPSPKRHWQTVEEYEERRALETTELFVAMTRARDGLFLICDDEPCDAIYEGLQHIDEVAV